LKSRSHSAVAGQDDRAKCSSRANLRPTSRGSIHARSADAADPPAIVTNYLSTPEDQQVAIDAIRLTRRVVAAPALRNYRPVEHRPGAEITSDGDLIHAAPKGLHNLGVAENNGLGRKFPQ